jgi:pheromone shutdown protein TraB
VRHNSIHDTDYIKSEINNNSFDIALIEKHPEIDISNYRIQTRKIFGFLRQKDIDIVDFDKNFDQSFFERIEKVPDRIKIDYSNGEKSEYIRNMRKRIENNRPKVYQKIFEDRESVMRSILKTKIEDLDNSEILVVVGESHVIALSDLIKDLKTKDI